METGKEIMDKMRAIKGSDSEKDIVIQKNRATVAGFITGSLFGMYYGYSRDKNMLAYGLFGGIAAAVLTRFFMPNH